LNSGQLDGYYGQFKIDLTVGVAEDPTETDLLWLVYPNPAVIGFTVQAPVDGSKVPGSIVMYDMTGRILFAHHMPGRSITLNTSATPPGAYLLVVRDLYGERMHQQTLILEP